MKITAAAVLVAVLFAKCPAQTQISRNSATVSSQTATPAAAEPGTNPPKIDPAKEADIRQLLKVMGAGDLAIQVMDRMETNMRPLITKSLPPGDYRDQLVNLFLEKFHSKIDAQKMVDLAVPSYDKYMDDADIKSLIQLYQSPIGQKILRVLPKITAEAQAAGEQWGREIGQQSMMEVLAEHPDLRKALEQATQNAKSQQP